MRKMLRLCAGVMALSGLATGALAQVDPVTAPNSAGRVYVRMLFSNANDTGFLDLPLDSSFHQKDAGLDLLHLLEIPERYGFDGVNDVGSFGLVTATTNILGTQLQARYIEDNGVGRLSVTLPCRSGAKTSVRQGANVVNFDGVAVPDPQGQYAPAPQGIDQAAYDNIETNYNDPYSVVFFGVDPDTAAEAAFAVYEQFLEADSTNGPWQYRGSQQFTSRQMLNSVYGCAVSESGINPLVGNPDSLQQRLVEAALDFTTPELSTDEGPWGLGLRVGRIDRDGAVGTQYDVRINRAFRLSEGNRSLLIVDVPVSYQTVKGMRELRASAAVGLRMPVSSNWSLEPRVAFGYVRAIDQELEGRILTGSLSSLYKFDGIGRGSVTLGNLVGYTKVLKAELYGYDVGNRTDNIVFRNGLAYDLPLTGQRIGNRQSSLRTSYAFTHYEGDDLYTSTIHEATLSVGVRSRETDARNSFEMFRVGAIGKLANNYKSGHLFVGYRF